MKKAVFTLIACGAALLAWQQLFHREDPARQHGVRGQVRASTTRSPFDSSVERLRQHPIPATDAASDANDPGLTSFVQLKYSYLDVGSEALLVALEHREGLAIRLNTLRQARVEPAEATVRELEQDLALADERIRKLMHPADYAEYALLRDANEELHALREYAGGISHVVPLTVGQERNLLFAKLTYKEQLQGVLNNAALDHAELPVWQRMRAYEHVARTARHYHGYFLQQARHSLHSEDQFTLLSNYETTELERELSRLHLLAMSR